MMRCLTQTAMYGLAGSHSFYHFHPVCGRPKATDLFSFYCHEFFWEVNKIITLGIFFLLFDIKNKSQ